MASGTCLFQKISIRAGLTGQKAYPQLVPQTTNPQVSTDPVMRQLLYTANAYKPIIEKAMEPVNSIKQQMGAVEKYGMDYQTKTQWLEPAHTRTWQMV